MATYTVTCEWCGKTSEKRISGGQRSRFCDKACSARWRMSRPGYAKSLASEKSRETARANMNKLRSRLDVQRKLRAHLLGPGNPLRDPKVRRKSEIALRERGYSMLSGGNGRGLTIPQQLLSQRLAWPTEYVVKTRMPRSSGYPSCYKLDLAEPTLMIGVELDGESHKTKRVFALDRKKADFLRKRGWVILRFENWQVLEDISAVVAEIMDAVESIT